MKKVYSVEFFEEGLRSDGFYQFDTMAEFWRYLSFYADNGNKVTVSICEHEIEQDCDICNAGSIKNRVDLIIKPAAHFDKNKRGE